MMEAERFGHEYEFPVAWHEARPPSTSEERRL